MAANFTDIEIVVERKVQLQMLRAGNIILM